MMCKYQVDNGGEEFEVPGRLPLHVAGQNGAAVEVVKALLEAYPNALTLKPTPLP